MVTAPGAESFAQACAWTAEVYRAAGLLMAEAGRLRGVADEGGFWPDFDTNEAALDMLARAIERAGFRPGEQVAIALDVAASEFGQGGRYRLALEDRELDSEGMGRLVGGWLARYPIVSVEDPLGEDDWEGFAAFTSAHGERVQVVGDDLLRDLRPAGRGKRRGGVRPTRCSSSPTSAARSPRRRPPGTPRARRVSAASSRRAPARRRM